MTPLQTIESFSDLAMDIEVQVDRKSLTLRQVLELGVNSVVKLTRSAGENMDVLIGGTLVCHGEIVVIEDTVGIRITDFREED
jgi:flagellar motor switch protein FliN/FliY